MGGLRWVWLKMDIDRLMDMLKWIEYLMAEEEFEITPKRRAKVVSYIKEILQAMEKPNPRGGLG